MASITNSLNAGLRHTKPKSTLAMIKAGLAPKGPSAPQRPSYRTNTGVNASLAALIPEKYNFSVNTTQTRRNHEKKQKEKINKLQHTLRVSEGRNAAFAFRQPWQTIPTSSVGYTVPKGIFGKKTSTTNKKSHNSNNRNNSNNSNNRNNNSNNNSNNNGLKKFKNMDDGAVGKLKITSIRTRKN